MQADSISHADRPLRWLRALLLLLAIKALWLWADAMPRLFMGDSTSYLLAAASHWMPPDRSFTYPFFLRYAVMPWQSPYALIVAQSLLGAVSAWLVWLLLRRRLGVPEWLALAAAALFACDPAQVFYERMVMAEACGGLALIAMFYATVEYAVSGRVRWLVAMQCLGLLSVSLRLNLLPVVLTMGVIAPLLSWTRPSTSAHAGRRIALHLLLAIGLLAGLHGGYRQFVAREFDTAPAWLARSGLMKFGLVAPLVKPQQLWAEGISPNVLSLLHYELADPDLRNAQMWAPYGLGDVLGFSLDSEGDALAGRIAQRALREDPMGLLRLDFHNAMNYFDPPEYRLRLRLDEAWDHPYPPHTQVLAKQVLRASIAGSERIDSPARRWFGLGSFWLVLSWLALAPLGFLAWQSLRRDGRIRAGNVLLLYALGLPASHLLFSAINSFRYLHPMPAFALIALAVLAAPRTGSVQRPSALRRDS